MAKVKTVYICQSCGHDSAKWLGKCPTCNQWNSFVEEKVKGGSKSSSPANYTEQAMSNQKAPQRITEIQHESVPRLVSEDGELNRVLGGGIVAGCIVLIGGEPGIGKSTLLLQLALQLGNSHEILYVSGEESAQQIKMRADRMGGLNSNCFLLVETDSQKILNNAKKMAPDVLIIDSIQTLHSPYIESTPGSVSQIRECAGELQRFAKESNTPVFLVGHITKDGAIAGPKILEHMVDTVLQFEGDRSYSYRILRTKKNRFGSTAELGIYEMHEKGLRQVKNPSELLLSENNLDLSGISIAATMEGLRPLLIETQALVSSAVYGNPQRSATGFDIRRLNMLLAVLEKRCGFKFGDKDVFINIAGGIKVEDPAIDLSIIAALLSSFEDKSIPNNVCMAGEVGLSGEVRSINRIDQRIAEADRLGFEKIFISTSNKGVDQSKFNIEIVPTNTVYTIYKNLFL